MKTLGESNKHKIEIYFWKIELKKHILKTTDINEKNEYLGKA